MHVRILALFRRAESGEKPELTNIYAKNDTEMQRHGGSPLLIHRNLLRRRRARVVGYLAFPTSQTIMGVM